MIEPTDLDEMASDEYQLDAPATGPIPPATPAPLPRMWKADDSDPDVGAKPEKQGVSERPGAAPSRKSAAPDGTSRDPKKGAHAPTSSDKSDDPDKKKVLVEETPEWDTYETRQRARLFLGATMISVVFFVGLFAYRMLPSGSDETDETNDSVSAQASPSATPNLELEARAMIDRAKEHEKGGRHKASIALLEKVVKVYPKVEAAKSASEALERAKHDQPLFPDRPPVPVAIVPEGEGLPDGIKPPPTPADPAKGLLPTPPPADFNQSRPADPAKGLAMTTPTPAKIDVSALPKPAPSVDPSKAVPDAVPDTPKSTFPPLPHGFHARSEDGRHESGWPRVIVNDLDGEPMIFIPEGTFIMGANGGPMIEEPAHKVQLRSYYIDQHEVTIGQFDNFLDATKHRYLLPRNWIPGDTKARQENKSNPVTMVAFKDAEAYAKWNQRQLPTEAQWEMAARSESSRIYPWGAEPITWAKPRTVRQVDPVMSYPQDVTPLGVFDLAGNVAEWTQDWFDPKYFQQFADSLAVDPSGASKGSRTLQRVVKGASKSWHASYREGVAQERRLSYLGFRCVLNINSAPPVTTPAGQPAPPARPNLTPAPIPF